MMLRGLRLGTTPRARAVLAWASLALAASAPARAAPSVEARAHPTAAATMARSEAAHLQVRRMPSVIDSTLDVARRVLARNQVVPRYRNTGNISLDGRVFAQAPAPGQPSPPSGSTVTLDVYRYVPAQLVAVPNVVGLPLPLAVQRLQRAGLLPRYPLDGTASDTSAIVSAQDVPPGIRVAAGTPVTLTVEVSSRVPWVVGLPLREAEEVMKASGFVTRARVVPRDGAEGGDVIAQSVDSGLARPPGTTIILVATDTLTQPGGTTELMPGVVGMPRAEAIDSLGILSPRLTIVEQETQLPAENDRVVAQSPAPGTVVPPDLEVVLRVGRYVEPAQPVDPQAADSALVPSLVGRPMAEVRARLEAARLTLGEVSAAALAGDSVVAAQVPAANTVVAVGSAVSITLQPGAVPPVTPGGGGAVDPGSGGGRLPWWVIFGTGVALGALLLLLLVGRRMERSSADSPIVGHDPEPPQAPRTAVTLRPSTLPPPWVDLPDDRSVVASEITLVSPPPEVIIDVPDSLIAREEVPDEHDTHEEHER